MTRPRALFVSPEPPYPAVGGGPLRSASLLAYLGAHCDVDLISFREHDAPDPAASLPPHLVQHTASLALPPHSRSAVARFARNAGRFVRARPPLVDRFSGFDNALAAQLAGKRYDLAVIEHFWCAQYAPLVRKHASSVILDLHNVESVWHERLAAGAGALRSLAYDRFATACRALESALLPCFDTVLAPSQRDASYVHGTRAVVYPNAIPHAPLPSRAAETESIVFTGNLAYEPNIAAVRHFHSTIWPHLRNRCKNLVWRIAGKNSGAILKYINGDPRIRVESVMDDALASIARSAVTVVPLRAGSGTRIKIIEAFAAGTPVISTRVGAEGLEANPGEHLLIADEPLEFAEAVAFLLTAPEARAQLAAAGRALFEARYTWQRAWEALDRAQIIDGAGHVSAPNPLY